MAVQYWLVKSEPGAYSWQTFVDEGQCYWDGVRNYQARNNMKAMKKGDLVLFYHSVKGKEIVGIARVVTEHYQDPTTDDKRWCVIDLVPVVALNESVSLKTIKDDELLCETALVKQSRLSVMPFEKAQFNRVLKVSGTKINASALKTQVLKDAGAKAQSQAPAKTSSKKASKSTTKKATKAPAKPKVPAKLRAQAKAKSIRKATSPKARVKALARAGAKVNTAGQSTKGPTRGKAAKKTTTKASKTKTGKAVKKTQSKKK